MLKVICKEDGVELAHRRPGGTTGPARPGCDKQAYPRVLKHSSCVTLIFQVACGRFGCVLRSAILKLMRIDRLFVDAFTRMYTAHYNNIIQVPDTTQAVQH